MGDGTNPRPADVRLVVVADAPAALVGWLSPATRAVTLVVPAGEASSQREHGGLVLTHDIGRSGWDVLHVPLDGPAGALLPALEGLAGSRGPAAGRTAAMVSADRPPAPTLVAGIVTTPLTPAVDLTGLAWATATRVWLTGRHGIAVIRHGVASRLDSVSLAEAMGALDLPLPSSPARQWLDQVASGLVVPTGPDWDAVLGAIYVDAVAAEILRRS